MAFDFTKAQGSGTDTMDRSVLGPPFLNIIQKGSPEFDETHRKYKEKQIEGCRPGNILLESEHVVLPQPITVVPLTQFPHYTEWKPHQGGFVGHRSLDITSHRDYRKGTPGSPTEYREYLGSNELVYTILFVVLFEHNGEWKKGMIAFTAKQLKKARIWSKVILGVKFPDMPDVRPPIFAAKYQLTTVPESNIKGGWFGWEISAPALLDPASDQNLLETAFEASKKAQLELPRPQATTALNAPVETEVVSEVAPY